MEQIKKDDPDDDLLKGLLPAFIRNSVLSRKPSGSSSLGLHKNIGTVSMNCPPQILQQFEFFKS